MAFKFQGSVILITMLVICLTFIEARPKSPKKEMLSAIKSGLGGKSGGDGKSGAGGQSGGGGKSGGGGGSGGSGGSADGGSGGSGGSGSGGSGGSTTEENSNTAQASDNARVFQANFDVDVGHDLNGPLTGVDNGHK